MRPIAKPTRITASDAVRHSLVEVEHNNVNIDICVNKGCGAVHLDPGEMEKILEGEKGVFKKVKISVFSVFK